VEIVPLTVTFDTNTLASVVSPSTAQRATGASGATIRAAIQAGLIQGFFCETLVTIEGISSKDRKDILGKTRLISGASPRGRNGVSLTVGFRHAVRKPLDARFRARLSGALGLGMYALMAPARMGWRHVESNICPLFKPTGGDPELWSCMDKVNDMATRIACRGVGSAVAIELGKRSSQAAPNPKHELWLTGLGHAGSINKLNEGLRELADGDTVAAHYGFGIDLLCSEDSRKKSVFQPSNRKWLSEDFGVRFVTLMELAQMVGR
jgi:hypothetical protein